MKQIAFLHGTCVRVGGHGVQLSVWQYSAVCSFNGYIAFLLEARGSHSTAMQSTIDCGKNAKRGSNQSSS